MKSPRWPLIGGLATVVVILAGAFVAWQIIGSPALNRETQRDAYDRPVSRIVFDHLNSNDIVVHARSGATGVKVERQLRWNGDSPTISETWNGDVLTISVTCHGWTIGHQCSVDYTVDVAPTVAIEADVSSGDITLDGSTAPVRVHTSSGDIRIRNVSGDSLDASTTSGDLTIDGLSTKALTATTTSGDIAVAYAAAPTTVEATATSGDVTVTVPRSDMTYKVRLDSTSGDRHSDIGSSDTGAGSISLRTSSGDVRIRLA
jgi:hypothetical protein